MPSALDRPRFFDDPAHSEWEVNGQSATGPRSAFREARAFAYAGGNAPDPTSPRSSNATSASDEAIGIEIVRGANGPADNTWAVVVDGLRVVVNTSTSTLQPAKIILPRGVALEELTPQTRVRPVLVAVRLEAEALAPERVEVAVDQVLRTSELAAQEGPPGGDQPPLQTGAVHTLVPYRVGDATAPSLILPYPFWAPAQSAVGILSLKPVNRYEELQKATAAYNLWINNLNFVDNLAYNREAELYEIALSSGSFGANIKAIVAAAAVAAGIKPSSVSGEEAEEDADAAESERREITRGGAPKKPLVRPPRFPPEPPAENTADSTAIGGGDKSAARELADMFASLSRACIAHAEEAAKNSTTLTLRQHLQRMRVSLSLQYDSKLLAFFDALFTTDPYPPTRAFLEREAVRGNSSFRPRYNVSTGLNMLGRTPDTQGAADAGYESPDALDIDKAAVDFEEGVPFGAHHHHLKDIGAAASQSTCLDASSRREVEFVPPLQLNTISKEGRQELQEKIGISVAAQTKNEFGRTTSYKPDYMFTYERLPLQTRRKTLIRAQIRVTVIDYDGSRHEFVFESQEEDGIVAHAVYEQLPMDIAALDYYASEFVDCMFRTHACLPHGFTGALAFIDDKIRPYILRKYARKKKARLGDFQISNFGDLLPYLGSSLIDAADTASGRGTASKDSGSPFKFDAKRMEERVLELRVMIREILPVWPPPPPPTASRRPEKDDLAIGPAPEADVAAPAAAEPTPVPLPLPRYTDRQREAYGFDSDSDIEASVNKRLAQRLVKAFSSPRIEDTHIIKFTDRALANFSTNVLVRRMPQIVKPTAKSVLFQMLTVMEPPLEELAQSSAETGRWGWLPTAAKLAGRAAATYGLPLLSAWLLMELMLDESNDILEDEKEGFDNIGLNAVTENRTSLVRSALKGTANVAAIFFGDAEASKQAFADLGVQATTKLTPLLYSFIKPTLNAVTPQAAAIATFYEETQKSQLLPIIVNVVSAILSFQTPRVDLVKEFYVVHRKTMRGKPVASAISAANAAFRRYSTQRQDEEALFGPEFVQGAVYDRESGNRFLFIEYYDLNKRSSDVFSELLSASPLTAQTWSTVPDGNAMRALPPPEVSEALYVAEELRGLPLTQMVEFTAGSSPAIAANTPAELAAKAAIYEVAQTISRDRRGLRGEHLMQSPGALVVQIAQSIAVLIRAAYGPSAGYTAVFGDDVIWSCVRGGAAARLAIRHLDLFEQANVVHRSETQAARDRDAQIAATASVSGAKTLLRPPESDLKSQRFWSKPRRAIVEQFTTALLKEANEFARTSAGNPFPLANTATVVSDASKSYARVQALLLGAADIAADDHDRVLLANASAAAHRVLSGAPPSQSLSAVLYMFKQEEIPSAQFHEQLAMARPRPPVVSSDRRLAALASKRIATTLSREQPVGDGVSVITEMLSGLAHESKLNESLEDHVYYFPMGSSVDAMPSRTPFDPERLGKRVVWLEALQSACDRLAKVVVDTPSQRTVNAVNAGVVVDTHLLKPIGGLVNAIDVASGPSRHPLAISVRGNTVKLGIADMTGATLPTTSTPAGGAQVATAHLSIEDALRSIDRKEFNASDLVEKSLHARRIAYNAERLLFAQSVVSMMPAASTSVVFLLHTPWDVAAAAIAVAISEVELGVLFPTVQLRVHGSAPTAASILDRLSAQADTALKRQCKVCMLSEVAMCVN